MSAWRGACKTQVLCVIDERRAFTHDIRAMSRLFVCRQHAQRDMPSLIDARHGVRHEDTARDVQSVTLSLWYHAAARRCYVAPRCHAALAYDGYARRLRSAVTLCCALCALRVFCLICC